ncbi:MAG: hypothetical protein LBU67_06115 [Oscillospiraceae bacterium]|jgi:tRNA nucleotidyltransferase (CCA-adding enzyme)|nr:hypothetical protein [Oscillospiraceae bacterium]
MDLPVDVRALLRALEAGGYAAWVVGGCVRDMLMGRTPSDWDVCTDALTGQVAACFPGHAVLPTGEKHGTVTVVLHHQPYEVTTFRTEGAYSDGRHPDTVRFVPGLREDLSRRDFTVNAMAYHPDRGLVDPFGGRADIAAHLVRCVGKPTLRFGEDALRVLRALRFAAVLGFALDAATADAVRALHPRLALVAAERLRAELDKLLCGPAAPDVLLTYPDALVSLLPTDAPDWRARVAALARLPREAALPLRLAALWAGLPAARAQETLARLKYDNRTQRRTLTPLAHWGMPLPSQRPALRRAVRGLGADAVRDLLALRLAFAMGDACAGAAADEAERAAALLQELLASGACCTRAQLAVRGDDLLVMGVPPGPGVGRALDALLDEVIEERLPNARGALLAWLQKTAEKQKSPVRHGGG